MICKICKKQINDKSTICPHCGTILKKDNTNRIVKNKYIKDDQTNMVGSDITSSNHHFVNIQKNKRSKPINIRDFNSYIDYKEAKKYEEEKNITLKEYKKNLASSINNNQTGANKANSNYSKNSFIAIRKVKNDKDLDLIGGKKSKYFSSKLKEPNPIKFVPNFTTLKPVPFLEVNNSKTKKRKFNIIDFFALALVVCVWIIVIGIIINNNRSNYYFKNDSEVGLVTNPIDDEMVNFVGVSRSGQNEVEASLGITSIVYDYQYLQKLTIKDIKDVNRLISADSIKQKSNCPNEIIEIEEDIISKYNIVAVNLCEMNLNFAKEIRDIIKYIYNNFPTTRNYLTNITLGNVGNTNSYIAAFMPVFTFATSNTNTGYPVAIKTQIILNAKYFLNTSKIENSVNYGARTGYFPKNATSTSTVAHEFGHFLSYVAMLNYYNTDKLNFVTAATSKTLYNVYDDFNKGDFSYKLLQEAYQEYQINYGTNFTFDGFRGDISTYAVAKDNSGNYIYDETIAEAFHDCFLNGPNAKLTSQTIIDVLKSKL